MATVAEIIAQHSNLHSNTVSDDIKVTWLRKLEQTLINNVILTHKSTGLIAPGRNDRQVLEAIMQAFAKVFAIETDTLNATADEGKEPELVKSFDTAADWLRYHIDNFDMNTELLAPEPYDEVYVYYIEQRIALMNSDAKRYNLATDSFNNQLLAFLQYYNRTHEPVRYRSPLFNHRWL